jgi:hypothetical protein
MKVISLLVILSLNAFAVENDCPSTDFPIVSMIMDLSKPNCLNEKFLESARQGDSRALCGECKESFQKGNKNTIQQLTPEKKRSIFFETALKEYQKNITNNLVETIKLRALNSTSGEFKLSTSACKMKTFDDFTKEDKSHKKCNSKEAIKLLKETPLLQDINNGIRGELAKILSNEEKFQPQHSLLNRKSPACFIPEKLILSSMSSAIEESLSQSMIEALSSLDASKYSSMAEMFLDEKVSEKYEGDISELISSLKNHPLLYEHLKSPLSLSSFFKSIPSPKNLNNLKKSIYSQKSGDNFDKRLAKSCEDSFQNLKDSLCSDEFEKGSIALNPFLNYKSIYSKNLEGTKEDLITSEDLDKKNRDLLALCEPNKKKNDLDLATIKNDINSGLDEKYSNQSLSEYQFDKYESDIGSANKSLCEYASKKCKDNSYVCKLVNSYNDLKTNPQIANASNESINKVLRSMIGDTSTIDPATKEILISNGIIPKSDGSLIAQPEVPERNFNNSPQAPAQLKPTTIAASASPTERIVRSPSQDYANSKEADSQQAYSDPTADLANQVNDQDRELKKIQDEIKRRLAGLPNKRPSSMAEAKNIANQSFRSQGKNITPEQEAAFAQSMMQPEAGDQAATAAFNNSPSKPTSSENRAAVSNTATLAEKFKAGQRDAALMGMAGAQQASGINSDDKAASAASEAKAEKLTKVSMKIAEDPKVTLSDIFSKKLDQNDKETQLLKTLLKNKSNFLLEVNSMNFKVVFNDKNNFNVLLESGDKNEAERIRPQLEMFLNKLKRNNSLSNLNQSW